MKDDPLPDTDHIIRYIKPTSLEDGVIDGSGFELKPGHRGISSNWLECIGGSKAEQIDSVRRLKRTEWRKTGCLAELNVGATKEHVATELPEISMIEDPLDLDPQNGFNEADPSHSLIYGVPHDPPERREAIQDMIAQRVIATHRTTLEE